MAMRTEAMKKSTILTMTMLLLAGLGGSVLAQDTQELTVPLSKPGEPVFLEAGLLSGDINVEGYDGDQILVNVESEMRNVRTERNEGMRVIPNTSMGLSVEEQDNHVEVSGNWASRVSKLAIKVPRRASMELHCTNDCDINVQGVEGELELHNTNGSIFAYDVSGSVIAHTTNGEVKVTFDDITPNKAMSFVTFHGDVDVTFPSGLKTDLRMSTSQGDIYTDFEFTLETQKPKINEGREGGRYKVELKDEVYATIGGGGPEMHFKTWSGDIYIRRAGR
jgi:hypothetical protein